MTRARFILSGDEDLTTPTLGTDVSSLPPEGAATALGRPGGSRESAMRERFEQVREAVICAPRDAKALKEEITAMRERVRKAHPAREGLFDVKQSAGGMMDVEFAVQYLVLMHSAEHKALRLDSGNIALLHAAEDAGLLPQGIGHAAADAYRELRRIQHQARLDEAPTQLPAQQAVTERSAVLALWHAVFD